jgi:hypothetical protein
LKTRWFYKDQKEVLKWLKVWVAIHSTSSGFWRRFYFLETFKRIFFQVWVQVWAEQSTSTGSDPEG